MGRICKGVVIIGLMMTTAACWPTPGQNPNRTGHNEHEALLDTTTVDALAEQWTVSMDYGVASDLILSSSRVHAHDLTTLYGINTETGNVDWTALPSEDDTFFNGPITTDGQQVLASQGHFTSGGFSTWSHDPATGSQTTSVSSGVVASHRPPRIAFMRFNVLGEDLFTYLHVEDLDGDGWTGLVSGEASWPVTLGTDLVYHAGDGLMGTEPGETELGVGLRAFPVDGAQTDCGPPALPNFACPEWVFPLDADSTSLPVLDSDQSTVYISTGSNEIHALDAVTGAVEWEASLESSGSATPALADGFLFVPRSEGQLLVFDAEGCEESPCDPLWSADAGNRINHQPAVAGTGEDAVVFAASANGDVHAYPAAGCGEETCEPLWSASTGSQITSAPAVSDGQLYVGTLDGRVIAYGL